MDHPLLAVALLQVFRGSGYPIELEPGRADRAQRGSRRFQHLGALAARLALGRRR